MQLTFPRRSFGAIFGLSFLVVAAAGCGGSGNGQPQYPDFAYYLDSSGQTAPVNMNPTPPSETPPAGGQVNSPTVTVYKTLQFASAADYYFAGTNNWTPTSQVAYGKVSGVSLSNVRLAVFALTDQYYVQPMVSNFVDLNSDGSWLCLSAPGDIHVMLVSKSYSVAASYGTLPTVDGVNVLFVQ